VTTRRTGFNAAGISHLPTPARAERRHDVDDRQGDLRVVLQFGRSKSQPFLT
jgi:hypothetical protein